MIAYLPQRVFEITGLALGAWMVTFGVVVLARPAGAAVRSGRPILPRAARAIGVASVALGLIVGAGSFFLDPDPQCRSCTNALWGWKVTAVHLAVWIGLPAAFAGLVWVGRHRRR
jgi:hypothetical protein